MRAVLMMTMLFEVRCACGCAGDRAYGWGEAVQRVWGTQACLPLLQKPHQQGWPVWQVQAVQ